MIKKFVFPMVLAVSFGACGKGTPHKNLSPSALPPPDPIVKDALGWQVSRLTSEDGSIHLIKREMPSQEQEIQRQQYRATDLIQLPVSAEFNTTLFKIKNIPEYENAVFIAPKLFAYGSAEQGRLVPQQNKDGTISLSFPMVMTDGSVRNIQSPNGALEISLPESYQIQNFSSFVTHISEIHGATTKIAPLPGCPKRITVLVGNREYNATPQDLSSGDYCQTNAPFTVTVTLPQEEAQFLLEKALYAGIVDVRAVYETKVAFAVSHFKAEFNKSKLFRDISTALGVKTFFANADVRTKVTEVIQRDAIKVGIQGDFNSHLDTIVNQAIQLFFEPFRTEANTKIRECQASKICFKLNYNYSREEKSFVAEWFQSSNAMTGQNYITWTKLKPIHGRSVRFGEVEEICRGTPCQQNGNSLRPLRPMLSNLGGSLETGLTVLPGDLLEINPTSMVREKRELQIPMTKRQDNVVCVEAQPIMERKCACPPLIGGIVFGPIGAAACAVACHDEHVGDRCVRTENQWIETTTYSMGNPEYLREHSPVAQLDQLFDGLALRFVWRNNGIQGDGTEEELTCPLNLFKRYGDGRNLLARIENQPGCRIFTGNSAQSPMLYLINQISFPVSYLAGKSVRDWRGTELEAPTQSTYQPRVDLAGMVAIKGYAFESLTNDGRLQ